MSYFTIKKFSKILYDPAFTSNFNNFSESKVIFLRHSRRKWSGKVTLLPNYGCFRKQGCWSSFFLKGNGIQSPQANKVVAGYPEDQKLIYQDFSFGFPNSTVRGKYSPSPAFNSIKATRSSEWND